MSILQDPQTRDEFIASQKFEYERGTIGYRGWNSGLYSDALCRRVDPKQRSLANLVREEVFIPLGEESSFFCPPVAVDWEARLSEVHDIPTPTMLLGVLPQVFKPSSFYRTILGDGHLVLLNDVEVDLYDRLINKKGVFSKPTIPDVDDGAASYNNRSSFMSYNMMSANCLSNSRALGRALDAFMGGKVVSKETVDLFLEPFPAAYDILLGQNTTYTKGGKSVSLIVCNFRHCRAPATNTSLSLPIPESGFGKDGLLLGDINNIVDVECNGWGGIGGSTTIHCTIGSHTATFSYVPNVMSPKVNLDRGLKLLNVAIDIIKK